jgi:hypothetical protein
MAVGVGRATAEHPQPDWPAPRALKRAIADDDAAIKLEPSDVYAFYTRGLAEVRQGSKTQGQSDLAAAQKLQPGIGHRYENIGLTP